MEHSQRGSGNKLEKKKTESHVESHVVDSRQKEHSIILLVLIHELLQVATVVVEKVLEVTPNVLIARTVKDQMKFIFYFLPVAPLTPPHSPGYRMIKNANLPGVQAEAH
jgi:hypothetical protein